jgi:hypothetical protein
MIISVRILRSRLAPHDSRVVQVNREAPRLEMFDELCRAGQLTPEERDVMVSHPPRDSDPRKCFGGPRNMHYCESLWKLFPGPR